MEAFGSQYYSEGSDCSRGTKAATDSLGRPLLVPTGDHLMRDSTVWGLRIAINSVRIGDCPMN